MAAGASGSSTTQAAAPESQSYKVEGTWGNGLRSETSSSACFKPGTNSDLPSSRNAITITGRRGS